VNAPPDLRSLCQVLLNACPDRGTLQTAEALVRTALLTDQGPPDFQTETWTPVSPSSVLDQAERRSLVLALSPAMLLEGAWLARVAQPAMAHLPVPGALFAIYCRMVGPTSDSIPLPLRFRNLLTALNLDLPPLYSPTFFSDPRCPDFALHLPCLHLSLLHRPRTFFPELLGYTLAHCFLDPAWWARLAGGLDSAWVSARERFSNDVRPLASAAWESYLRTDGDSERIRAGWHLYRRSFEALLLAASGDGHRPITAQEAMADIVRTKRPYAVAYHRRVMLRGRSLDRWLEEAENDPAPLLEALRNSPYVNLACPAASRLIRAMDFGGSMFGAFTADERRLCLEWIENPAAEAEPEDSRGTALGRAGETGTVQAPSNTAVRPGKHSENRRRLFTALLRAESSGDCPPEAAIAVERMLRRSRRLDWLKPGRHCPRHYDPAAFSSWIESIYRREVTRYRPPRGDPGIGREFCLWAILQLAPAILVDGCWLAGIPTASENLGEVERHLLHIYADEVGMGKPEQNHANVYRRLLESLDLAIPDFETEAFARDPRFVDAAFEFPAYMLAIGLLKNRYFPEMLGLNLAIELSGLGAAYMQVVDILRHHGIDPAIIQLHQTIDNLESGHAARARDAVLLYLDRIRRSDSAAVQAAWFRVRLGYLSLQTAVLPLAGRLIQRYFADRLKPTRLFIRRSAERNVVRKPAGFAPEDKA
jgi:hypothetical protein